jgi:hypothetical protein
MTGASEDSAKLLAAVRKIHELSHAILYAYLQYPTTANIWPAEAKEKTVSRCTTLYTDHFDQKSMNDFEVIIKDSITLVMEALCKWSWDLFEFSERHTANRFDPLHGLVPERGNGDGLARESAQHAYATKKLMSWLFFVCMYYHYRDLQGAVLYSHIARHLCSWKTSG